MAGMVIIGAGHAAGQAAASLRQEKYTGPITIIGDEAHLPYQRPPLSKAYLSGSQEVDRVYLRAEKFYQEKEIDLKLSTRATAIDPDAKAVELEDGSKIDYDKLLISTGSRPRLLSIPGSDLGGIHYLRTIDDVDGIRADMHEGANLVIVGGGYIGLEVAAVGIEQGLNVHVLEMEDRILQRVTTPTMSKYYDELHRGRGVQIHTNTGVTGFSGDAKVQKVMCGDTEFAADMVIVGIGIVPNIELAEAAGIICDDGIVVDDHCQTSNPDIYAAGDCTIHPNPLLGRTMRLESVPNAIEQGKAVASDILAAPAPYHQIPWFWSDQYDVKLQIAGVPERVDQKVLRGDDQGDSFAWFYFTDGKLTGVTTINRPAEFMAGRQLILKACAEGHCLSPDLIEDEEVKPKAWLTA